MRRLSILFVAAIVTALVSFTTSAGLTVTSTAFTNNNTIPPKYSCEGTEVSPALKVENIPANTQSLALIVHDPDAPMPGGFTHWVMWNLSTDGIIPENFKGAEQGLNGSEETGYKGMCPPTGTHHYHFYVYALNTKLNLSGNTNKADLEKAMQGHILAEGKITGLYKKIK
jgi:Raf kinase inhibitor-like YbhB/YbcL family protein